MNKLNWKDLLTVFKSTGLSDHSYLHFFDEYNFLKLTEHNDVVVLTSESWRADYSPMLLDYCMKQNIEFDSVNSHTMWMNPTAFLVNRAIEIPAWEVAAFEQYLSDNCGPILHTKTAPNSSNYSLYDVDKSEVFFQYLIIKYNIKVDSIFKRNMDNVSLHVR